MLRLFDISIIVIVFIIISFIISILDLAPVSFIDTLSYALITIGMSLVYSESISKNSVLVFFGSIIFLVGIYFLITENFNLQLNSGIVVPFILIFTGVGLLTSHISIPTKTIFLWASIILLSVGLTLFIINSHFSIKSFSQSMLPVIVFLWPVAIILIVLVLLIKIK